MLYMKNKQKNTMRASISMLLMLFRISKPPLNPNEGGVGGGDEGLRLPTGNGSIRSESEVGKVISLFYKTIGWSSYSRGTRCTDSYRVRAIDQGRKSSFGYVAILWSISSQLKRYADI